MRKISLRYTANKYLNTLSEKEECLFWEILIYFNPLGNITWHFSTYIHFLEKNSESIYNVIYDISEMQLFLLFKKKIALPFDL